MCKNCQDQKSRVFQHDVDGSVLAPDGADYLDIGDKVQEYVQGNDLQEKCQAADLSKNVAAWLYENGMDNKAKAVLDCGSKWIRFACPTGHEMLKQKTCAIPYCPTCGKKGSWLNKRRAKRLRSLLLGYQGGLGHVVFTIPKQLSADLPDSQALGLLYKEAWKIMQNWLDAPAAVIVMHFCGDKTDGLHLHLDCTFPILEHGANWYSKGILEQVRFAWTMAINQVLKPPERIDNAVIYYNFAEQQEQQLHLIKYVTRSTIPAEKFVALTNEQKLYIVKLSAKNTVRYFGGLAGSRKAAFVVKYQNKNALEMIESQDGEKIEAGICPICNVKMRPVKNAQGKIEPLRLDDYPLRNFVKYNGYIYIDREIDAFLRLKAIEQEKEDQKKAYFDNLTLLEKLKYQELFQEQETTLENLYHE